MYVLSQCTCNPQGTQRLFVVLGTLLLAASMFYLHEHNRGRISGKSIPS